MKDRGKACTTDGFPEFNFSAASEMPCKKHPSSSSVGICAYCLKDRLVKLVCSECGEQRLSSSCSCSDDVSSSSYRNSCSSTVGSVGRVSFLIENEKFDPNIIPAKSKRREDHRSSSEQVIFLRRSSSSCVEVKKTNGFWRIKRLFRKKRSKGDEFCDERNNADGSSDEKSEIWVRDYMGVARSRSLCSFRGGGDEASECALSSAKISDVTGGIFLDSDKQWGYSGEPEGRRSGFCRSVLDAENGGFDFRGVHSTAVATNRSVFPAKESDFSAAMDESAFIDLKLDLATELKEEGRGSFANMKSNGGSCRVSVNERGGLKRDSRSHKVWKWIFKYHPANKKGGKTIF
ncbi:hypothetical protein ABFS83_12G083900 [Erythranthe nasuta]